MKGILPFAALTAMALLFGLSFVVTKFALQSIPPFTLIFLRFSIASLLLGALYFRRRNTTRLLRADRWRMFSVSLIVPGLYFLAETYGLKLSSATSVSLLISTIPIFAAIFAFFIRKEGIGFWRGVAITLSIVGVGTIISADGGKAAAWKMIQAGNLLGLGAAGCAGLYMALGRDLMTRYSPLTMTTFQAFFAVAIFLPLAGTELSNHGWRGAGPLTLLSVMYLALFCSVLAFLLWNYGISRLEASKAAVFTNLVPVFTVIGAGIFLGERIHPAQVVGGALVIGGVTLASATRRNLPGCK
jgi:drug/metabolite transporter (DMT)-like permease